MSRKLFLSATVSMAFFATPLVVAEQVEQPQPHLPTNDQHQSNQVVSALNPGRSPIQNNPPSTHLLPATTPPARTVMKRDPAGASARINLHMSNQVLPSAQVSSAYASVVAEGAYLAAYPGRNFSNTLMPYH